VVAANRELREPNGSCFDRLRLEDP
jgi:hypothetical protein